MVGVVGSSPIVPTKQNPRCAGLRRRSFRIAFFVLGMIPGKLPSARDFRSARARGQAIPFFSGWPVSWSWRRSGVRVTCSVMASASSWSSGFLSWFVRCCSSLMAVSLVGLSASVPGAMCRLRERWQGLAVVARCLHRSPCVTCTLGNCLGKASFEWGWGRWGVAGYAGRAGTLSPLACLPAG